VANQVVGPIQIDRLMALLARGVDIATAVEADFNIDELVAGAKRSGQRPAAVIEVDSGMRRCCAATPAETVRLARRLVDEGIDYRGIMGYEGHMYGQAEEPARTDLINTALATVNDHVEALAEAGLAPRIVSTSGTASVRIASKTPGVTELQAGTYVFNDLHTEPFIAGLFENALTLLLTVISVKDRYAVGDAGLKSLSNDTGQSFSVDGTAKVARLSEEHCTLTGDGIANLKPGQRIEVVPSHGDTTLNMHDVYYGRRGDGIIDTWPILGARRYR
jgi:D-serine deaminase-like pyridoxal phosphate-dependent protein